MSTQKNTTLFIPNLHCPSCTAHIEDALYALHPPPRSVNTSIISHTVSVQHSPSLPVSSICAALDEAGFEIFDTVTDSPSSEPQSSSHERQPATDPGIPSFAFEQALWKWRPLSSKTQDQKSSKHVQSCQLCQAQKPQLTDESSDTNNCKAEIEKRTEFVTTESVATSNQTFQAIIAVDGMTCSSCVGSVTRALESAPWVHSTSVSLLTHTAGVTFHGKHHAHELVDMVEDIGFGASLESVEEYETKAEGNTTPPSDLWKATYAITGMSCSACTSKVTTALRDVSWIKEAQVSLISNSATIILQGKERLEQVKKLIEDVGYDATLDSIANLQMEDKAKSRRKLWIRVSGMYCQHCAPRIESAVKQLGPIDVEKMPTMQDPVMTVGYLPQPPSLTVRNILQSIRHADEAFEAAIYHPMSLEERSREMQARERRHILYRLVLSIAAAIPSFIIGIVLMNLVPSTNQSAQYLSERIHGVTRMEWATFIIATPVYFLAADIFHRRTLKELRALWRPGSPTPILQRFYRFGSMNMLISLGTTIAYLSSVAELAILATDPMTMGSEHNAQNPTYFDSVVFLTMFLLIGRLIEAHTKAKTGDAVAELGKLRPSTALLLQDKLDVNSIAQVAVDHLEIGDVVRVLNGASPPFDGIVVHGDSKFDESALTGESKLVEKELGDEVFSGTINNGAPVCVRIDAIEGKSMLDQIMRVVREGQAKRAPVERVADMITGYFVPVITLIAMITWITWMVLGLSGVLPQDYLDLDSGGWPFWALEFAIAVFVVACPCGIGLAAPTALFVGGGLAAKHGILVKGGGEAFQEASHLDCVVFDKTGTLTEGAEPKIANHETYSHEETGLDDQAVFGILRAIESASSHPIAKALVAFCADHNASSFELETEEVAGRGMKAYSVDKGQKFQEALVGNETLMADYNIAVPSWTASTIDAWKGDGKSVALVAIKRSSEPAKWTLAAAFAISDTLRKEAKYVVKSLQSRKLDVWMISGDNATTARAVGAQVGIPEERIIAGVLPSEKSEKIKKLQLSLSKGKGRAKRRRAIVAMVGDGINDSPALATADVGIAIGSGSDVAISSADFVLVSSNLTAILTLTDLSRAVFGRIKVNFGWALIYNLIAVPIAAGVLYPFKTSAASPSHIRLDPVWAALAMALSSVSVVCSSLLLRSGLPVVGFRAARSPSLDTHPP